MKNLPGEILHNIFIHLPIIQKQECMLVCRHWKEIISTRSLFYDITCRDTAACYEFADIIKRTPTLGTQVNYLDLCGYFKSDYDKLLLLCSFPNLREINLQILHSKTTLDFYLIKGFEPTLFPRNIELIREYGTGQTTCLLAAFGLCSHLITLNLNLINFRLSEEDIDTICEQTKHMPVLLNLEIWCQSFTMHHCEIIHTNLPSLTSLSLRRIKYHEEDILPVYTKPSTSLIKLILDLDGYTLEYQHKWFTYIMKKYPNLKHFRYGNHCFSDTHNGLKHRDQLIFSTVIQNLGPNLTSLDFIYGLHDPALFKKLDDYGCKIKNLTLGQCTPSVVDALSKSNQSIYIEKLTVQIDTNCSFEWLRNMKKLKVLSLEHDSTIKSSTFFQLCPATVESVTIDDAIIEFDSEIAQKFAIKELTLCCNNKGSGMGSFISNCFPHLKLLTIRKHLDENDTFIFPNHHFDYLQLSYYIFSDSSIAITSLDDNRTRYYNLSDQRSRTDILKFDNYIAPIPKGNIIDKECINIVCGSVKDLVLGSVHASLI